MRGTNTISLLINVAPRMSKGIFKCNQAKLVTTSVHSLNVSLHILLIERMFHIVRGMMFNPLIRHPPGNKKRSIACKIGPRFLSVNITGRNVVKNLLSRVLHICTEVLPSDHSIGPQRHCHSLYFDPPKGTLQPAMCLTKCGDASRD